MQRARYFRYAGLIQRGRAMESRRSDITDGVNQLLDVYREHPYTIGGVTELMRSDILRWREEIPSELIRMKESELGSNPDKLARTGGWHNALDTKA
jgi:hypothetical protein